MDKNHTDKRFRDKLGDYAREPDPHVWERIHTSLNARKRRRLIPVWWYLGGAAAVLLLSLFLLNPFSETELETPAVSDTEAVSPDSSQDENGDTLREETTAPARDAVAETPAANTQDDDQGAENDQREGAPGVQPASDTNAATAVAGNTPSDTRSQGDQEGRQTPDPGVNAVAVAETAEDAVEQKQGYREQDPLESDAVETAQPSVQDTEIVPSDTGIAVAEAQEAEEILQPDKSESEKISIFDAIEEAEEEAVAETGENRWAVGPSIAPVYFNSFGDGSPISPNFVANSKSGTMNLSYGLTVAYEVTKKLSVRSGIHKVDFGYNTNDVAFSPNFSAVPASLIQTISYSENSKNVVVQSTADNRTPAVDPVSNEVAAPSLRREGRMMQQFGYLEVPLEMQYNLVDRKLGLNVIGGVSSLFLVDNSISLDADGAVTEIGEATNMNDVSFSTNVGLGVYYKLNSALHVQVQPMFKYHMNTFSQTNGSFQPYSIGVYSGVQLRF